MSAYGDKVSKIGISAILAKETGAMHRKVMAPDRYSILEFNGLNSI
jgi:hypothetical protein